MRVLYPVSNKHVPELVEFVVRNIDKYMHFKTKRMSSYIKACSQVKEKRILYYLKSQMYQILLEVKYGMPIGCWAFLFFD